MTKFDDLHAQFISWDAALREHEQNATQAMLCLLNGFRAYLGRDAATDQAVKLCKIDHDGAGISRFVPVDHFANALSQDEDGAWRFGLIITFAEGEFITGKPDQGQLSYTVSVPRSAIFFADLRFTLNGEDCVFQISADPSASFASRLVNDGQLTSLIGIQELCEYLSSTIESVFRLKPGEVPKLPIGFDLTRPAA